jgi:gliding motility-associated-like protein
MLIDAGAWPSVLWSWGLTDRSYWVTFSGVYVVDIQDSNGCMAIDSIAIDFFDAPLVNIGADQILCPGTTYTLDAGNGMVSYAWSNGVSSQVINASPGTYDVTVTDGNSCSSVSNQVTITAYPAVPAPVISGDAEGLVSNSLPNYQWYWDGLAIPGATAQTFDPDSSGDYYVEVIDTNGCGNQSSNVLTIDVVYELTYDDIPEGFSPNGDGINDAFEVRNLDAFPGSALQVFGRWGQLVFERSPYSGDFRGASDNGSNLPDGTYFYILDLGNGQDPFSGTLIINR